MITPLATLEVVIIPSPKEAGHSAGWVVDSASVDMLMHADYGADPVPGSGWVETIDGSGAFHRRYARPRAGVEFQVVWHPRDQVCHVYSYHATHRLW